MPPPTDDQPIAAAPGFQYEPLRASVLDVFEQLGAFDEDSGLVEWMFPDVHEEKQRRRPRVKLTEMFDEEPEPEETPRKSRLTSRFFGIRSRSRSKSQTRGKKENKDKGTTPPKSKKTSRSSPNLRKDKETLTDGPLTDSPEPPPMPPRRMSIFQRKPPPTQDEAAPRPSISDEEWQQITMTGSIADYETANPFISVHSNSPPSSTRKSNDSASTTTTPKRSGPFSRFTSSFTRSTPASPTREHAQSPLSRRTPPTSDPATPTQASTSGPMQPSGSLDPEVASTHSNASTSTLQAVPAPPSPEDSTTDRVPLPPQDDDRLETTSQIDHVRMSLSDISEGEGSETAASVKNADSHRAPTPEEPDHQELDSSSGSEDDYGVPLEKQRNLDADIEVATDDTHTSSATQ
ncbi:hypothetical protein HMN09_00110500 [Mycena chlorophos]|uniref:Uncharacterized protein n=1 Tax=Mycena chlorophos TaxID=658473 RepID=A0A8H6WMZ1_MYCCL|nr:hypothetical protein HMN09_00110500 [Mycena chlorophos]